MDGLYTNYYYTYQSQLAWRKQLQVCAQDIFDKYFLLSIPSSTLSEKSLKDVLAAIDNQATFTESLQTVQAEGKLRLVLDRVFDHLDELTDKQKQTLLIGIFDFCEDVEDRKQQMFDIQAVDDQTWRLGYQALMRVPKENRVAFLTTILHATTSIFSPIQLIIALNHQTEELEKKESQDEALMTTEELSPLNNMCVDKIKSAAGDGTLVTNQHFDWLLLAWKELDSEAAVKEYVAGLIQTTSGLLALLRGFEWESFSHTVGDRVEKRTRKLNKKTLAMLVDIDELDKRVQALSTAELSQEDREIIALYNAPLDWFDRL